MLGMANVWLELIPDVDMYLFFEKDIRGGVSYIYKWYTKANNKYLKSYDPKQEPNQIICLDPNNLYGYAMLKCFSTGKFKRMDPKMFDLNKYYSNSLKDYVLYVDLEYLKELLHLHNYYPLAPDKKEIKEKMLPKYEVMIADLYIISIGNVKKSVPDFFDKEKNVLHYVNLPLFLSLGLRLK